MDRRRIHHLTLMFRLSQMDYINVERPEITLPSRLKIKFDLPYTRLTKVQNSPYYRGVSFWDRLAVGVQRAMTKVKFKTMTT